MGFGDKFSDNCDTISASIYILWSEVNLCAEAFCDLRHLFVINGNDDILKEFGLFGIFPSMLEHGFSANIGEGFAHESCRGKTRRNYSQYHLGSADNFGNFEELVIFI